jgi:hypothetical protein
MPTRVRVAAIAMGILAALLLVLSIAAATSLLARSTGTWVLSLRGRA